MQPAQCGHLRTTKSLMPTHHCQVTIGQLHRATLPWRQLTLGSQRKSILGGWVSKRAGGQNTEWWPGASHFPIPCRCCHPLSQRGQGWLWQRWVGWVAMEAGGIPFSHTYIHTHTPFRCHCPQPLRRAAQCDGSGSRVCENGTLPSLHCHSMLCPPGCLPTHLALPPSACSKLSPQ